MKAVDPNQHCLEPFLNMVAFGIVELTAQLAPKEGSQIATAINQKLRLRNVVFLGEMIEKRRPQKSGISDVQTRTKLWLTPRDRS